MFLTAFQVRTIAEIFAGPEMADPDRLAISLADRVTGDVLVIDLATGFRDRVVAVPERLTTPEKIAEDRARRRRTTAARARHARRAARPDPATKPPELG